jgi:hypothetical protein
MRLNGWQRLGVVASVMWAIGAFLVGISGENRAWSYYKVCMRIVGDDDDAVRRSKAVDRCGVRYKNDAPAAIREQQAQAAFTALVPIPFAWFFTCVGIWIVRWIRRGFARPT